MKPDHVVSAKVCTLKPEDRGERWGGGGVPNVRRAGGLVSRVFFSTWKPLKRIIVFGYLIPNG